MLIALKIGLVRHLRYTYDWHNHHSGRTLGLVYFTTNQSFTSRGKFDDPLGQQVVLVNNEDAPEQGDVPNGNGYISKYASKIMFRRDVSHL